MDKPIFYNPSRPSKVKAKAGSNHPLAGRQNPSPSLTAQSHHSSQRAEHARLLSSVDLVEVVDLTGVDFPEAKQQPANGNTAGIGDKIGGAEKRGSDDVRPLREAVVDKEWDDSLIDLDSIAAETSLINRSGTGHNVSILARTMVGDSRDNLTCADDSPRDEGAGTGRERLDTQPHPLDTSDQDCPLTEGPQTDSGHDKSHLNPDTTTHAIAVNSSSRITDDQPPILGATRGGCDEDMDKHTQPIPTVPGPTERTSTPEGPGTLEHGTDAFRSEPATSPPTDVGLLDNASKLTGLLDHFPPGSPTEVATQGSSPVDIVGSSQGEGHSAPQDVSAIRESSQQVLPPSPHRPEGTLSLEASPTSNPPSKEYHINPTPPTYTSTSKASPLGKDDNNMDYVSQLSPEQRDQYASLSHECLPNTKAHPQRDEHQAYEQSRSGGQKRKAGPRVPAKSVKRHRPLAKVTALPFPAGGKSSSSSSSRARSNTRADQRNYEPPPVDVKNNRYAVECLLGRREVIQYHVRWEGYGPEHDEWVDENEIYPPLIQAYAALTRSAGAKVGVTMAEEVEGDGVGDVAELIEDHTTQRSSRTRS